MSLLWEIYQTTEIHKAQKAAKAASASRTTIATLEAQLETLTKRFHRLALCNQALWELIRDGSDLTDNDLSEKIREIDLRDGREDNRIATEQCRCPACHRPSNSSRHQCLYCGTPLDKTHLFE